MKVTQTNTPPTSIVKKSASSALYYSAEAQDCYLKLRQARDNNSRPRFSPQETVDIFNALGNYRTTDKKPTLLNVLLKTGLGQKDNSHLLSANDIVNFLELTSGKNLSSQVSSFMIMKQEKHSISKNNLNTTLDEVVFKPLKQNQELLDTVGEMQRLIRSQETKIKNPAEILVKGFRLIKENNPQDIKKFATETILKLIKTAQ